MIEIIILACHINFCKEFNVVQDLETTMTPMQCMMISPQIISLWSESHPNYYIRKWRCQYAGLEAKI